MKTFKFMFDVEQLRNYPFRATLRSLIVPIIDDCPHYLPQKYDYIAQLSLYISPIDISYP